MTFNEYQTMAQRTSPDDGHDKVLNGKLGLIGEAGEVVDVVKKWMFQSGDNAPLPVDKLVEEIGDVLWYCAEYCTGQSTQIGEYYNGMVTWCQYPYRYAMALAKYAVECDITSVISTCEGFLQHWCDKGIDDVMEKNIEKLKRRYPDGFDVNRSMNRKE